MEAHRRGGSGQGSAVCGSFAAMVSLSRVASDWVVRSTSPESVGLSGNAPIYPLQKSGRCLKGGAWPLFMPLCASPALLGGIMKNYEEL